MITGTSTGIGWGTTKVLISRGFRVFGSVRKTSDAKRLSKEFGDRFLPLLFDVTDEAAVSTTAADVRTKLAGERLAGLVNNAGVAVAGPLLELSVAEFRHQIDVNLVGVVITTKAFAPLIGTDPQLKGDPGRIINIGSVSGRNAVPFLAPYAASKFALEGLSESLRRETARLRHRRHRDRSRRGSDARFGARPSKSISRLTSTRRTRRDSSGCAITCSLWANRVCRPSESARRCFTR